MSIYKSTLSRKTLLTLCLCSATLLTTGCGILATESSRQFQSQDAEMRARRELTLELPPFYADGKVKFRTNSPVDAPTLKKRLYLLWLNDRPPITETDIKIIKQSSPIMTWQSDRDTWIEWQVPNQIGKHIYLEAHAIDEGQQTPLSQTEIDTLAQKIKRPLGRQDVVSSTETYSWKTIAQNASATLKSVVNLTPTRSGSEQSVFPFDDKNTVELRLEAKYLSEDKLNTPWPGEIELKVNDKTLRRMPYRENLVLSRAEVLDGKSRSVLSVAFYEKNSQTPFQTESRIFVTGNDFFVSTQNARTDDPPLQMTLDSSKMAQPIDLTQGGTVHFFASNLELGSLSIKPGQTIYTLALPLNLDNSRYRDLLNIPNYSTSSYDYEFYAQYRPKGYENERESGRNIASTRRRLS